MQPSAIGESLVSWGGCFRQAIASAAGTVTLKAAPARLCRILVTAAGTAAVTVFDNATAASGTILFVSPTTTTLGQIFDSQMPAQLGITVSDPASGPGITVTWN
jgi:hypothetical protein